MTDNPTLAHTLPHALSTPQTTDFQGFGHGPRASVWTHGRADPGFAPQEFHEVPLRSEITASLLRVTLDDLAIFTSRRDVPEMKITLSEPPA